MYELTRGFSTLFGVAVGGFLVWLATQVDDETVGGYWAEYGLLAGAGLVLALALAFGSVTRGIRPAFSPGRFLFAWLPALVVVGWIALANQPGGAALHGHFVSWSGDLSIGGVVGDMGAELGALALALGVIFGFCFDTVPTALGTPAATTARDADEPLTAERRAAVERDRERVAVSATAADDGAATPSREAEITS
jgi:hypothetical protein